ncbi:MAG: flagellar hook-length control protein FliK [Pseudomonadota bacterium]
MNTPPLPISPARTVDANTGGGRESGVAGTPFSQVLSDEMASQRNAQADRAPADKSAAAADAAHAEAAPEAAAATAADAAVAAEAAPAEPLDPALLASLPDAAALFGAGVTPLATPGSMPAPVPTGDADGSIEAAPTPAFAASRPGRLLPQRADPQAGGMAAPPLRADAGPAAGNGVAPATAGAPAMPLAAAAQTDAAGVTVEPGFEQMLHAAQRSAESLQQSAIRPGAEAAQPRLAPAVGSSAWGQALGEHVVWMTASAQQSATLTLNPPHLGPLQVVLNMSNDQAVANFFAAQPEVRQALESALPRLKDMLNDAGIQLQQATVSADTSPQQQDAHAPRPPRRAAGLSDDAPGLAGASALPAPRVGRGLVDTFA